MFEYSGLASQPCPARARDLAVAHVRTLDMDPKKPIHEGYGQPPLSYYLSAWQHSGMRRLLVVYKSARIHHNQSARVRPAARTAHARRIARVAAKAPPASEATDAAAEAEVRRFKGDDGQLNAVSESPVVQGLEMLQSALGLPIHFQSSDDFVTDLRQLLCARTLIASNTALNVVLFANPRLERMYQFDRPDDGPYRELSYSCRVPRFTMDGRLPHPWTASDAQKLQQLVTPPHGSTGMHFRQLDVAHGGSWNPLDWAWCECDQQARSNCSRAARWPQG
jgi:hypothetical protein